MGYASDLRLTNADVECMPDDGNRYELIDGELYVSSAPGFSHQTMLVNIVGGFLDCLRDHQLVGSLPRRWSYLRRLQRRDPRSCLRYERTHAEGAGGGGRFRAAPEILIEILSPGATNERRDRHIKRNLYAARGAAEYWIVDPENRSVDVHRGNEAGDLVFETSLLQTDELTSSLLPGFGLHVDTLFV